MVRFFFLSLASFAFPLLAQDQVQINTPYLATPLPVVDAMLVMAHVKHSDVVYDLGCGDGRILIKAAKIYGARGIGIDNNPERIREAQENARREGVSHLVNFRVSDLYDEDIQSATLVALYLLPDVNLRLKPKLKAQLRPGARIVSHSFDMGQWKPDKKQTIQGENIYLWKIRRRFWFFA